MLNQPQYLKQYGLAIATVVISLLIMLAFDPVLLLTRSSYLLFFGAVTLSALYGGRESGIVATLLSAMFANYFFVEPQFTWVLSLADILRMVIFILEGVLVSVLIGALRTAQQQARKNLHQLQATEAEIRDLNHALQCRVDELYQSEESYRRLFTSIDEGFFVLEVLFDENGNPVDFLILQANPALERHTGIANLVGKKASELSPGLEKNWNELYAKVVEAGGTLRLERRSPWLPLWFDLTISPVNDTSMHQLVVVLTNITDRKQSEIALRISEARFRRIFECNMVPMGIWSITGVLLDANDALLDLIGYTQEELAAGQINWQTLTPPEWIPLDERSVEQLNKHGFTTPWEKEYFHKQGHRVPILMSGATFEDNPDTGIFFAIDLTELKKAEAEREQLLQREQAARAEAEHANRVKDEFLSILSHELRSPLTPILGWSKLLQTKTMDNAKTVQALGTIERNAKLQTQLIDDLLDIAKILRGKLSLDEAPVNLVTVIKAALEVVTTTAEAKKILLVPELTDVGQVWGDSGRLQQIIWNLLSNAIKFTPTGGRVEIRLERVNDRAQIGVIDTGKGISAAFLPHIFESFRQEDISITRRYGGLGLGLSIVKHLVDAHNGTVTADSLGEGEGATFTIKLPLLKDESISSANAPFSSAKIDLAGIKVLVVDDCEDSRELLTTLLTQYGGEPKAVASGEEVFALLNSFKPHVLVCDIGMPEMDGYTLLQQIRALPAEQAGDIPAIALTAYAKEEDYQYALNHGFQRHIAKPLEPERLAVAVAELAIK